MYRMLMVWTNINALPQHTTVYYNLSNKQSVIISLTMPTKAKKLLLWDALDCTGVTNKVFEECM